MLWKHKNSTNFLQIPLDVRGRLYVSPMPYGPYDPFNRLMKTYRRHRVSRVVVLVTDSELKRKAKRDLFKLYDRHGIRVLHAPFADMTAPTYGVVRRLVPKMTAHLNSGQHLAVHCNAGVGRTGVVISCLVKRLHDMDGPSAVAFVTNQMMIQMTEEQKRFVDQWEPLGPPAPEPDPASSASTSS